MAVLRLAFVTGLVAMAPVLAWMGPEAAAQGADRGQWITLGTSGGPGVRATQSQIANALVVGSDTYVFDAGEGALRQIVAAKLSPNSVRAIFISHHHSDHIAGVPTLLLTAGNSPLKVFGPPGTKGFVDAIARAREVIPGQAQGGQGGRGGGARENTLEGTDFAEAMTTPTLVYEDKNIKVSAINIDHYQIPPRDPLKSPTAVSYRIEVGGRTIVYTGDTGPSERLITLAKGADLLVSEVAVRPAGPPSPQQEAQYQNWTKNHLIPTMVGRIAAAAGVKAVVLTHYVGRWETDDLSEFTKGLTDEYKGPVRLARDLDRF